MEFFPNCFPQTAQLTSPKRLLLSLISGFSVATSGTFFPSVSVPLLGDDLIEIGGGGGRLDFLKSLGFSLELSFALEESSIII